MSSYVLGPVARDLLQYAYNLWINSRDKASAWFTVSDELSSLPDVMSVVNDLVAHHYLVCSEDEFDRYYCLGPNGLAKVLSLRAQAKIIEQIEAAQRRSNPVGKQPHG